MGDADRLALARRAMDLDRAGDRRLRRIVADIEAVVMVRSAIKVLAGAERLGPAGELDLERFGIGDVEALLESVGPPFQRLARDRAGTQHMVALLVEEGAALVPGHLVPGARQLLEADAGDPQDGIARHAVLL